MFIFSEKINSIQAKITERKLYTQRNEMIDNSPIARMLDTANCSLNCRVTAYDMIHCIEQMRAKHKKQKSAISEKQTTLLEHKYKENEQCAHCKYFRTFTCIPDFLSLNFTFF